MEKAIEKIVFFGFWFLPIAINNIKFFAIFVFLAYISAIYLHIYARVFEMICENKFILLEISTFYICAIKKIDLVHKL